ncbi:2-oxo acid dehydrogenase subunit E2 [Halopelagius fulvigenes]|uniref:2-oxo acid dehydrogenase subunit E2 n=1 Tax=Halopelagius fulvigenes TaxID=1198324 RepID=A0ABD5U180_9EURY
MSYVVKMPKLGLEMDSGTVVEWLAEEGDEVAEDDPVAEIESEKTTAEIDARESGVLRHVGVEAGESVPPGAALGIVAGADEDISSLMADFEAGAVEDAPDAEERTETAESGAETSEGGGTAAGADSGGGSGSAADVKASPRARKRAEELGVDVSTVEGSGPGGAITEEDVEAAAESGGPGDEEDVKASPRAKKRAEELGVRLGSVEGSGPGGAITEEDVETAAESGGGEAAGESAGPAVTEERKLSGMRRTIADRLGKSYRESVHVTVHRTMNAETALAAADAAAEQLGADVSLTDVLLKALSATLAEHPGFNATFRDDTHRLHADQNVCVAVDVEEGLLAPVVRGVDSLSLSELAETRREVTRSVLDGDYSMDDLSGGTFTVSNLGVLGVESFDPVINPPQVAILGVNAVEERVVPDDGGGSDDFTTRRMLPLDLSFDHRVVDGADAARFMATLSDHLDDPWPLLDGVEASEPEPAELPEAAATASVGPDLKGTVEAGSFEYDFDVTEEFGGGTAPTPVDLFVSSLAACLSASIGVQADIRDADVRNVTVEAEATPPEGSVESVSLTAVLDTDADDETVERIVRNGERTCHVNELLREDLPVSLDWRRA